MKITVLNIIISSKKGNGFLEFFKSFKYAIQGILSALKVERNMKIHIFAMIIVIICGIIFKINKIEWFICFILFAGVISTELINTAIENTVDLITQEKNPKAKIAKDIAAGAVLIWAIFATIIGGMIFIPKMF